MGPSPATMIRLFKLTVLPMLFCGVECWSSIPRLQGALKRLDQTLGLEDRMALGLNRFSSTHVALVIANIRPVRLEILRKLSRFMVRNIMCDLIDVAKA